MLPTGGCVTWALVLLGALVAGKLCNAAKKSCAGLSDTSCIRSIPSHLFFTALNAFIATGAFWLRVFLREIAAALSFYSNGHWYKLPATKGAR